MQNIMLNNEVQLSRGDTFSTPLFINKGTELKPLRYYLKDSFPVLQNSILKVGSVLLAGTNIMKHSIINGHEYTYNYKLESPVIITEDSTIYEKSTIFSGSQIKTGSILNNNIIEEDLVVCGDEIYLGLMEPNQPFELAILKKKYDYRNLNKNGDVVIKLKSEDTENLIPGTYYYTIKARLLQDDGTYDVNTIITNTQFKIIE